MSSISQLSTKIAKRKAHVGIVGMGYVGSALAKLSVDATFQTLGFVTTEEKAKKINKTKNPYLHATVDTSLLQKQDIIIICVQTPIYEDKTPDLRYLQKACETVKNNLQVGQLIIIESSIAPGTTRNFIKPILESSGLTADKDFLLAYSPERVDPGNKKFALSEIPKVVSGYNTKALKLVTQFYNVILKKAVPVSSLETAEMAKILENTFRLVNISLVNEIRNYTNELHIDIWEVIDAAATKPFGFMPHYPGPGVGGHCIPVDPYYLIKDAKIRNIDLQLVRTAGQINDLQPELVVKEVKGIISKTNGVKKHHKVLLMGLTYKPDIDDIRESPSLSIWKILNKDGIEVAYYDPYVPAYNGSASIKMTKETVDDYDVIIIATNHSNVSYKSLLKYNKPILDTRNIYKNVSHPLIYHL
jgi:UDP-N-acetyl-D-glucosamine dehydrogenase